MRFSDFDTRRYPTVAPAQGYRRWAGTYDQSVAPEMDLHLLARLKGVAWSELAAAVDLACGTGRIGQWLADRGVSQVDGIDITPEMIAAARAKRVYRRLEVGEMTATALPAAHYDLIISVLAVEHLPRLEPLYAEAARLATEPGVFVLVGYHPYFLLNGIPTHFRTDEGQNLAIDNTIHLLSDHVSAAQQHGWSLTTLDERLVDEAWIARCPNYARHRGRPVSFLAFWARSPSTSRSK